MFDHSSHWPDFLIELNDHIWEPLGIVHSLREAYKGGDIEPNLTQSHVGERGGFGKYHVIYFP